jgi:predicted NUDIX family phosphoesterase
MCVSSEVVASLGLGTGFTPFSEEAWKRLMAPENISFQPRDTVETDFRYKQIIPYCVLRKGDQIFNFWRSGTEKRLTGKRCIGVGGHITVDDHHQDPEETYLNGCRRELEEEVIISGSHRLQTIGFVNYDWDDVGKVHLGVVEMVDLMGDAEPREETSGGEFTSLTELFLHQEDCERWSQFVLRALVQQ